MKHNKAIFDNCNNHYTNIIYSIEYIYIYIYTKIITITHVRETRTNTIISVTYNEYNISI